MNVLVTGATGLVGSAVVAELLAAATRSGRWSAPPRTSPTSTPARVELVRGDVLDRPSVEEALRGRDAVVHAAGLADVRGDRKQLLAVNAGGVEVVLGAALAAGVARAVLTSSTAVLGGWPGAAGHGRGDHLERRDPRARLLRLQEARGGDGLRPGRPRPAAGGGAPLLGAGPGRHLPLLGVDRGGAGPAEDPGLRAGRRQLLRRARRGARPRAGAGAGAGGRGLHPGRPQPDHGRDGGAGLPDGGRAGPAARPLRAGVGGTCAPWGCWAPSAARRRPSTPTCCGPARSTPSSPAPRRSASSATPSGRSTSRCATRSAGTSRPRKLRPTTPELKALEAG